MKGQIYAKYVENKKYVENIFENLKRGNDLGDPEWEQQVPRKAGT
jgi:hypothetical protein